MVLFYTILLKNKETRKHTCCCIETHPILFLVSSLLLFLIISMLTHTHTQFYLKADLMLWMKIQKKLEFGLY